MKTLKEFKQWFEMYPPEAADSKGWKEFDTHCKENFPIRYWITETLIPNVWWPIPRFFKNIRDQIRWRTFEKMHIIDTKLKPEYYDCDTVMLHGMFSLLVDFVEIEKAWMQAIFCEDYKKPWYPFKRFRDKDLGIKYLDWEMTLIGEDGNPPQAEAAKNIKELYLWWTIQRPARIDPYDLMDDEKIFPKDEDLFDSMNNKSSTRTAIFKEINELEKQQDEEDTEMLVKLIKLRGSLWT